MPPDAAACTRAARPPRAATPPRIYAASVLALFHGLLLFGLVNLLAWCYLEARPTDPITLTYGRRPFGLVYPGRSEAEVRELLRETWNRPSGWAPFVDVRERRHRGRFVNIHSVGFRLSHAQGPWLPDPARSVFVFGGSTTFGYGVADDETIVSALQDYLDRHAPPPRVSCYNFGSGAYYSSEERVLLQELLVSGAVPRVVVFVDGMNEFAFAEPLLSQRLRRAVRAPVASALATVVEELPQTRLVARSKVEGRRPRRTVAQLRAAYGDPARLDARIERYLANRRLITAVASAWGARPLFVWQPVPTYEYDLRCHLFGDVDFERNNYSAFGYLRMAERLRRQPLGSDFLWQADLQQGVCQPLYVDQIHYTAAMSRLIGGEIGRALIERGRLGEAAPPSSVQPLAEAQ